MEAKKLVQTGIAKVSAKGDKLNALFSNVELQKKAKEINVTDLVASTTSKKSLYKTDFLLAYGKQGSSNTTKRGQIRRYFLSLSKTVVSDFNLKSQSLLVSVNVLQDFANKSLIDAKNSRPQFTASDKKNLDNILDSAFKIMHSLNK